MHLSTQNECDSFLQPTKNVDNLGYFSISFEKKNHSKISVCSKLKWQNNFFFSIESNYCSLYFYTFVIIRVSL